MTTRRIPRLACALSLLAFAGCGNGLDARAPLQPATGVAALERAPSLGEPCGTYERPCALEEIRVTGAAE